MQKKKQKNFIFQDDAQNYADPLSSGLLMVSAARGEIKEINFLFYRNCFTQNKMSENEKTGNRTDCLVSQIFIRLDSELAICVSLCSKKYTYMVIDR